MRVGGGGADFEDTTPTAFPSFLHRLRVINGIDDKEIV